MRLDRVTEEESCSAVETNPTSIHEDAGLIHPWLRSVGPGTCVAVNCGVGRICSTDPALLWLRRRPAAVASI